MFSVSNFFSKQRKRYFFRRFFDFATYDTVR